MKTTFRFASLILCCSLASVSRVPGSESQARPQVVRTEEPKYPLDLEHMGITSGKAELVIQVDRTGKLADLLVTAYTHKRFADEATRAVRKWTFGPAWVGTTPLGWVQQLDVNFRDTGVLIVLDDPEIVASRMQLLARRDDSVGYSACSLQDLDRIPIPRRVVAPAGSLRPGEGPVEVDFYIDEEGRVRVPVARASANDAFADTAVDAVRQWQFEPPTSKGKPVLVHAAQTFTAKPASPSKE